MKFRGSFKTKASNGTTFQLHNQGFIIETNIFWHGLENYKWEWMSRKLWTHLSEHSNCTFDIGANTGIFAILAKVHQPKAKVVAFEPQPNIHTVLTKSSKLNQFDIHCENLAVSNEEGELPFYNQGADAFSGANTTIGSLNKNWRPEDQFSITVQVTTLKSYVEEKKIEKIDLMKIDVETLEYEVLDGYGDYLAQHRPMVLLEVQNPEIGDKIQSLFDASTYSFYNIIEKGGIEAVNHIGRSTSNHNYLICPQEKNEFVKDFIN